MTVSRLPLRVSAAAPAHCYLDGLRSRGKVGATGQALRQHVCWIQQIDQLGRYASGVGEVTAAQNGSYLEPGCEKPWLGSSYFARATPPVLFVQGSADTINPPADSLAMYRADRSGPRFYLDLLGAGHLPPYACRRPPEPLVARVTAYFLDRYLAGQHRGATAMRRSGHVPGRAVLGVNGRTPP